MIDLLFLAGQTLADDELPAANALMLPRPQQRALELCLGGDRLDYRRRLGWRHPAGSDRVADSTIAQLERRGLIVVIRRTRFAKHARLTARGAWYARTLVGHAIASLRPTTTKREERA